MPARPTDECRRRLAAADHLVLATVHPERGVDVVPVLAALDGSTAWVPVDTVKPKSTTRLRRLANVEADPRVALLADRYDADWSQLWWVRVHGLARAVTDEGELDAARLALAARYPVYRDPTSIVAALAIELDRWSGWTAEPAGPVTRS